MTRIKKNVETFLHLRGERSTSTTDTPACWSTSRRAVPSQRLDRECRRFETSFSRPEPEAADVATMTSSRAPMTSRWRAADATSRSQSGDERRALTSTSLARRTSADAVGAGDVGDVSMKDGDIESEALRQFQ